MKFNEAFNVLRELHDQWGAKGGWEDFRDEAKYVVKHYKSYKEWRDFLYTRTNISDDDRWEIEYFEPSFKMLFGLMKTNQELEAAEKRIEELEARCAKYQEALELAHSYLQNCVERVRVPEPYMAEEIRKALLEVGE